MARTTAICFQTKLTRQSKKQPRDLRDECLLATQRSRTTLCEVVVRREPADKGTLPIRFRITVEPVPNEEIYRLVREFAIDLWDKRAGVKRSADESRGPSIEVERALRNMAGLKTQEVDLADGRSESRRRWSSRRTQALSKSFNQSSPNGCSFSEGPNGS
jgi:hypothetical protein